VVIAMRLFSRPAKLLPSRRNSRYSYPAVEEAAPVVVAELDSGAARSPVNLLRLRRQHASAPARPGGPRRVLILSANVGEGHAAAARALAEQLELGHDDVEVTVVDGLRAMGRVLHYVVEDGYRTQLRLMPWSYSLTYWLLEHAAPARWVTKKLLYRLGARSLRRKIDAHTPHVIVSTYPAVTVVLGRLRQLGLVDALTVATITDMTGLFFWAQRGIDMHLVMYGESIESVERIAGSNSVRLVRPLIAAEFLEPRGREAARQALGLPLDGKVIVVSGGGWGVGDIDGAVGELARIPDATIVCLAGKNDLVREQLTARFAGSPRVRVLGFTDKMSELLAAADVLVHSTGGVTCLEAMARGCPVVSYGLPVGHAKINTRAMADRDLLRLANSTDELLEHVTRSCSTRPAAGPESAAVPRASDLVLDSPRRVRTIPAWRPRLAHTGASMMIALSAGTWMLSTDEVAALAAKVFRVHTVRTVATARPAVAVVVRTPQAAIPRVAGHLSRLGVHASFALSTVPSPATIQTLRGFGDAPMCEVDRGRWLRWLQTRTKLRTEQRALHLRHHFFYLAPQNRLTTGQLLMASTAGARPVEGSVAIDATSPVPTRPLRRGDVVVVTLDGTAASLRSFDRFAADLTAERLTGVSFSALAG
jgi:UDP-N-acetylglucosamine:LPS N-acetylglucosamine transferase